MMYDPRPGVNPTPTISYRNGHLMAVEQLFEDATAPLKVCLQVLLCSKHANSNQSTPFHLARNQVMPKQLQPRPLPFFLFTANTHTHTYANSLSKHFSTRYSYTIYTSPQLSLTCFHCIAARIVTLKKLKISGST